MSESPVINPGQQVGRLLGKLWWLPLLRGVFLILLGVYALLTPGMTAAALAQVVGFFVILDGILTVAAGFQGETSSRGWTIVRGVIEVLVGIFVFAHPFVFAAVTATVLLTIIAIGLVLAGLAEIVGAVRDRKEIEGEGWLMLGGALAVLFGVLIFIAPLAFGVLIIRILGVYAIVYGVSLIVIAFGVRKLGKALGQVGP